MTRSIALPRSRFISRHSRALNYSLRWLLALLTASFFFTPAHAQQWLWTKPIVGNDQEVTRKSVTNAQGNTYVIGSYHSPLTVGNVVLPNTNA